MFSGGNDDGIEFRVLQRIVHLAEVTKLFRARMLGRRHLEVGGVDVTERHDVLTRDTREVRSAAPSHADDGNIQPAVWRLTVQDCRESQHARTSRACELDETATRDGRGNRGGVHEGRVETI